MQLNLTRRRGALLARIGERFLSHCPALAEMGVEEAERPSAVVLDLSDAAFVSSGFWRGCVALARELEARGVPLMIYGLAGHLRRALRLVVGAESLMLLDASGGLDAQLAAALPGQRPDEGVTNAEKNALWS